QKGPAPKIDSFRLNLLGHLWAVTNDVWMADLAGRNQAELARFGGKYLAHNIKIRRIVQQLNDEIRRSGSGEKEWTPAEVQAAAWSFMRSLARKGGESRRKGRPLNPEQVLNELTHEDVFENLDFADLLFHPKKADVREQLRAAGFGPQLDAL